ncbi:sulfotransferase 1C2-like [Watersipora subatra]|uniref:sulfotransferase 1C2-like n=1 Tax=Watersipora subatra TaxID=2589382 RepID=UPI00355C4C21
MESFTKHPMAGSTTGEYFVSEDGSVRVPALTARREALPKIREDLAAHKWNRSDFLLSTYPKTGTTFAWEVMTMLLNGSPEYINVIKTALMIDTFPISESSKHFPSPRVLNTHYRSDVLPAEFRKAKTVVVLRNPKDACVSFYHDVKNLATLVPVMKVFEDETFEKFQLRFLYDDDAPYGTYFGYTEYMWSLRNEPNVLVVFYEDLKSDPLTTIQRLNQFMGTNRSRELEQQIADATSFDKMKRSKLALSFSKEMSKLEHEDISKGKKSLLGPRVAHVYRKGIVGDWKNHFTVADNERFDDFLMHWEGGKGIPFKY